MLSSESPDAFPNFIFFIKIAISFKETPTLDFPLYQSQSFDPMHSLYSLICALINADPKFGELIE